MVLTFHGVPDPLNPHVSITPKMFLNLMRILQDGGNNVIAMRALADYFDPVALPSDPMTKVRCPDE